VLIKALYIGLVISVIAVLGVAAAIYVRVRKHMDSPGAHAPDADKSTGEHQV
jgi:hypothetical protein